MTTTWEDAEDSLPCAGRFVWIFHPPKAVALALFNGTDYLDAHGDGTVYRPPAAWSYAFDEPPAAPYRVWLDPEAPAP